MILPEQQTAARHVEPRHRPRGKTASSAEATMDRLRRAGIRPTRQRIAICALLFGGGDRHVTAELLFEEAQAARIPISLATIYNCLHTFAKHQMIRELFHDPRTTYYDTDASEHFHFVSQVDGSIIDVPGVGIRLEPFEGIPEGFCVTGVQVVVRLRPTFDRRTIPGTSIAPPRAGEPA